MPTDLKIKGNAALSICESTLLCLTDLKILTEEQAVQILQDAAGAHQTAADEGIGDKAEHLAVAHLINAIILGGNSVRR